MVLDQFQSIWQLLGSGNKPHSQKSEQSKQKGTIKAFRTRVLEACFHSCLLLKTPMNSRDMHIIILNKVFFL